MKIERILAPAGIATLALALAVSAPRAQQTDDTGDAAASSGGMQQGKQMQGSGGMQGMPGMMRGGDMGMMGRRGDMPRAMMMMFAMMDTDGDGALSLDEVMAPHERMFGYIDADDSGAFAR